MLQERLVGDLSGGQFEERHAEFVKVRRKPASERMPAMPFDSGPLDDTETPDAADRLMAALDAEENDPGSR